MTQSLNTIPHQSKMEELLILLIDIVIKTHGYENLEEYKKRLDELR